ncbi:MAG TPA: general secretion pathway protein GspB, partial [Rhodospirillales bacterium]|nr:general secretion pathway protein GspB [Rhodospirillales bacterium]
RTGSRTLQATLVMGLALALLVATGWAFYPWLRQVQEAGPQAPAAAVAPTVPEEAGGGRAAAPDPGTATGGDPAPAPAPAAAPAGERAAKERRPRRPYSSPASSDPATPRREPRALAAAPPASADVGSGGQADAEAIVPPPGASELVAATALRDLPSSVQRTLPSIAITLHRYATSTDARMVRVNGRVAREGDVIGGDLSVAEITRGGVVFTIGEQRFYMDAFQTWQAKSGS